MATGTQIAMGREQTQHELRAFSQGDPAAFETLFRQHQRAVYGWILRMVRDPGVAEDLAIETFFRIHRARARYDPAREFEPWARRIATRVALDFLSAQRMESAMPDAFFQQAPARAVADSLITAEIGSHVAAALSRLPAKLRVAALLAVVEEVPHKQVAEALGITVAAVKVRVFRALRLLRKDLERRGFKP